MTGDGAGRRRATRLLALGRDATGPVSPPLQRFSTVCFPTMAALREATGRDDPAAVSYGTQGGDIQYRLADAVAAIEGGTRCQVTGNGLAAIALALLATLGAGDRLLACDTVYGPTRRLADGVLRRLGIATDYYDPRLSPEQVGALITPATRVLLTESPGSNTFEMQDVAALSRVAHGRGALLALDNTWGFACFEPFAHGVDLSIQALTKYAGGHADLLLGAVTVADDALWTRVRDAAIALGQGAGPEDCWLALRGMRTLDLRLAHQFASSIAVAGHVAGKPGVARVLHPGLPDAPGHALWARDYDGRGASLFGIEFGPSVTCDAVDRFVDRLALFGKGWSWGGFESLANTVSGGIRRDHAPPGRGALCRLHVGLEDVDDLLRDIDDAWDALGMS